MADYYWFDCSARLTASGAADALDATKKAGESQ